MRRLMLLASKSSGGGANRRQTADFALFVTEPRQQLPFAGNIADNGGFGAIYEISHNDRPATRAVKYSTLRT
ncbi:hypothetical protein AXG89_02445 [Burkholderia sp. PAMC 26561]|nr:hypothetical protein AXG89_02445 [Burkholderia sp. PAMC 26561]